VPDGHWREREFSGSCINGSFLIELIALLGIHEPGNRKNIEKSRRHKFFNRFGRVLVKTLLLI
jgi:hypothetical protein